MHMGVGCFLAAHNSGNTYTMTTKLFFQCILDISCPKMSKTQQQKNDRSYPLKHSNGCYKRLGRKQACSGMLPSYLFLHVTPLLQTLSRFTCNAH